ncbi:hypothetical protein QYE76_051767 [Lolium multiflorum]|uniref:Uncharacterized protein n=1 Tax=Lolium multiflorum TaxID=4521 RepID=A0AAD8WKF9_LOLMU|nr:hypothetical protein QYE76_051767 [Lolium multiflorum]
MSCSSSPRDAADVDRRRHNQADAEEVPALDLLDDFWFFSNSLGGKDDAKGGAKRPPLLPKSPSTSSSSGRAKTGGADDHLPPGNKSRFHDASGGRRLLRTPSLPSPRIGMDPPPPPSSRHVEELAEEDTTGGADQAPAEDDDMNWSKIYEGVLRTRIAEEEGRGSPSSSCALHRAPSTPVPYSAMMGVDGRGRGEEAVTRSTPSLPRLRHSHSTLENHCRSHTPTKPDRDHRTPRLATISSRAERGQPRRDLRSFGATQHPATIARTKSEFLDKRWKSSSALESIEVQGFKDLGFVFDQEELRESLADVLPGLKTRGSSNSGSGSASDNDDAGGAEHAGQDDGVVPRPYLSEAWQHGARSAPPLTTASSASASAIRLQQADARSAAEMKDQLRMWAQAVACNVRQEC